LGPKNLDGTPVAICRVIEHEQFQQHTKGQALNAEKSQADIASLSARTAAFPMRSLRADCPLFHAKEWPMREITVSGERPHCEENRPFLEWQLSFPFWCSEIAVLALSFSEREASCKASGIRSIH
jgi:hypothetical protein